jgi:hypothetical protein
MVGMMLGAHDIESCLVQEECGVSEAASKELLLLLLLLLVRRVEGLHGTRQRKVGWHRGRFY